MTGSKNITGTVDKALVLLMLFTAQRPAIGLSEIACLAGFNKATARRLLLALQRHGLVEQDTRSRNYRLGAGVLRLARVREATFPLGRLVRERLRELAQRTGETAHCSMLTGGRLTTVGVVESPRANCVTLDPTETLPFHATASGIAVLAFLPRDTVDVLLEGPLAAYTDATPVEREAVQTLIAAAHARGVSVTNQTFETEVVGIAAPIFDGLGAACGAVAVATPASRMDDARAATIGAAVRDAAISLTRESGAEPPELFLATAA